MKPGPHKDKLHTKQLIVARALANGAIPADVCREFDVQRKTIDYWLDKPNFRAEIRKHIDVVMAEKVVGAAQKALEVIFAAAEKLDPKAVKDKDFERALVVWDKMQNAMKRFGAAGADDGVKVRALNITFTTKEGLPPPTIDALYEVKEEEPSGEDEEPG